jgi:hypothetical protein
MGMGCSNAAEQDTESVTHDRQVAAILTCGGGVFEYEGMNPSSRYDFSVKDGAQILVSVAHRVGWSRVSQLLVLGDDGAWLERQFEPGSSYDLKHGANKTVVSAAYLLGQYARRYCTEHPFDNLQDAIDNVVRQVQAKG